MIYKRETVAYITKLPFIPSKRSDKQIKVLHINKLALIMKKIALKTYELLPFKKEICFLIKKITTPNKKIYRKLYFEGVFTVKHKKQEYFKIKNYNYLYIEKCLFWKGLFGEWEKVSLQLWEELCKESEVIFDVGSNTGVYSLLAKSSNPKSKVYAFEPIKRIYDKLVFNKNLNNYDIFCCQKAVSNTDGKSLIYDHETEHTTTASLDEGSIGENKSSVVPIEIDLIKLDSFIENNNVKKIDLLKIDVETFEVEALEGFKKNLEKFKPTILIEILNNKIATGIEHIVSDLNYEYYNIDENGTIEKVENLSKSKSYNFLLCQSEISKKIKFIS